MEYQQIQQNPSKFWNNDAILISFGIGNSLNLCKRAFLWLETPPQHKLATQIILSKLRKHWDITLPSYHLLMSIRYKFVYPNMPSHPYTISPYVLLFPPTLPWQLAQPTHCKQGFTLKDLHTCQTWHWGLTTLKQINTFSLLKGYFFWSFKRAHTFFLHWPLLRKLPCLDQPCLVH